MQLKNKLKEIRLLRGMTQREIAEKLGIEQSTISLYETGERMPNAAMAAKIASTLGVSFNDIFLI